MNETVYIKAKKILDVYFSASLSLKTKEKVRSWFIDDKHREEKDNALQEIFEEQLTPNFQYDQSLEDSFGEISRILGFLQEEQTGLRKKIPLQQRHAVFMRAAAIALLVVAGGVGLWLNLSRPAQKGFLADAEIVSLWVTGSEQQKIALPDNSEALVSPGSNIIYSKKFDSNRTVQLNGEAVFSVKKDESVPFIVETNHLMVTVTGTKFRVASFVGDDQAIVDLYQGEVEVTANNNRTLMKPGERFEYKESNKNTVTVSPVKEAPMELLLENVTFGEAIRLIERKYSVTIKVPGDIDMQGNYSLSLNEDELIDGVLNILKDVTRKYSSYQVNANEIVLKK